MTPQQIQPRPAPCRSCPYRKDVPSGVWHPDEYAKLPLYDKETGEQPPGLFMCHCGGGSMMCRGWLDTHGVEELLAIRVSLLLGTVSPEIMDLPKSPVPLFPSGKAACDHGMRDVTHPGEAASHVIAKLNTIRGQQ